MQAAYPRLPVTAPPLGSVSLPAGAATAIQVKVPPAP
jgi:hypothetical protein